MGANRKDPDMSGGGNPYHDPKDGRFTTGPEGSRDHKDATVDAHQVHQELKLQLPKDDSFSINLAGQQPHDGFMVSEPGHEKIISARLKGASLERVERNYIAHNKALLSRKGEYFGKWVDHGKAYLDVSKNMNNKAAAVRAGCQAHQLAIYDLGNGTSIRLACDGRHNASRGRK